MLTRTALALMSPGGPRARLCILIFHRVLAVPDPLMPHEPCRTRFAETMEWIKGWFNVLPLDEAVDRLRNGRLPARAAAITFDDGYVDNLTNAVPILRKHGLHATFFIATGFLGGRHMWNDSIIESVREAGESHLDVRRVGLGQLPIGTIEQKRSAIERIIGAIKHLPLSERNDAVSGVMEACRAKTLSRLMLTAAEVRMLREAGMGVGAHTVNHPILASLPPQVARQELADSRDHLEAILGEPVVQLAYPNGKWQQDYGLGHAEMARELGFSSAVTTNWGACTKKSDPFQLPRFTPWDQRRWRYGLRLLQNLRTSRLR